MSKQKPLILGRLITMALMAIMATTMMTGCSFDARMTGVERGIRDLNRQLNPPIEVEIEGPQIIIIESEALVSMNERLAEIQASIPILGKDDEGVLNIENDLAMLTSEVAAARADFNSLVIWITRGGLLTLIVTGLGGGTIMYRKRKG